MKKTTYLIFVAAVAFCSCSKSYLDINQNPNQPLQVTPNVVLSAALNGSANNVALDYHGVARWMGYWSRSGNYVADGQTEGYGIPNSYTDAEWGRLYTTLNRYEYIENQGHELNFPFYVGVAKVMKALHFSTLVDCYNDVPYSDAFNVVGAVQPKYDAGQDIYKDLINQLDSAVTYFDSAKTVYATIATATQLATDAQYDIMFGKLHPNGDETGRMDAWVTFANTVKLKLLIHQSQVIDPAYLQTELAKTNANGRGYMGAGQMAAVNPGYQNSSDKISPLYGFFFTVTGANGNTYGYYRANSYAVNFYNLTGDEREFGFYTTVNNQVVGNYDGDPQSLSNSFTSAVGPGLLKDPSQDQLIMSDFESLFLQAEAAYRGWITGDAASLYQSAITQSYIYLNSTVPVGNSVFTDDPVGDAQLYYTQGLADVDWNASPNKLEAIITQKWAALNGINWVEAWTDYRRTGYPTTEFLDISRAAVHVVPQIPIRFLYPQTELNSNASNVPPLAPNAQFNSPVFWDK